MADLIDRHVEKENLWRNEYWDWIENLWHDDFTREGKGKAMKVYSESTLMGWSKKELVDYIKICYENQEAVEKTLEQHIKNVKDWEPPRKWTAIEDGLPEEKINPNTLDFEYVLCATTFGDVRPFKFGKPFGWRGSGANPHFWYGPVIMDEYVIAWTDLPQYKG